MLRAAARLRDEVVSVIEDLHVGSAYIGIVVVGEHESISILFGLEPQTGLWFSEHYLE